MAEKDRIDRLEAEISLMRAVIERFVEHPTIYQAASFRPLIAELGYEYYTDADGREQIRKIG